MIQLSPADLSMADTETVIRYFPFRIGRASDVDLSVTNTGVWEHHATVQLDQGRPMLLADGEAALIVNGERVSRHPLKSGDLIELGAARWRISLASANQKAAAFPQAAFWLALAALFTAQIVAIYRLTDQ